MVRSVDLEQEALLLQMGLYLLLSLEVVHSLAENPMEVLGFLLGELIHLLALSQQPNQPLQELLAVGYDAFNPSSSD